ncbi:MAG: hypothetical protein KDD11_11900 [Acidobacteria bacterium]|nr:hypothetical protein [Acidobacteriota bacterium]
MYLERLNSISNRIPGAMALSLVGRDGMPVESVSSDPSIDLETLAAELLLQVCSISDDHRELAVGDLDQFSLITDRVTLLVSAVTQDYFLLLVLGDEGNYGQARFELRRARLLLEDDL